VPHVLRELWVVSIRRCANELGENIPSRLAGKLKSSVIGWSMLPLLVGAVGLGRSWSPALIHFGQVGVVVGLVLSAVSGFGYTVSFVRIYERHRRSCQAYVRAVARSKPCARDSILSEDFSQPSRI
jgi:hypothetical protein